ncbi:hypothetical protein [Pseudoxanthomonas wuyuanensis]|uniref:hypothetical protein n=1 Tax=Pseudoxanthomonas wuyuanensis TaxID=1073196 RepID=UPI0011448C8D|nr:hypothetical protein [Pseudoxanthomonas wuyuanensis]
MKLRTSTIMSAILLCCTFIVSAAVPESSASKCDSPVSETDVVAVDHNANGDVIEYKRNNADVKNLVSALKKKIERDPAITQSTDWKAEMLTEEYWLTAACGGTKDCSSKTCPSGSCSYSNIGMAGCRCK